MILFQDKCQLEKHHRLILLFGAGLIGSSISLNILKKNNYSQKFLPYRWDDSSRQTAVCDSLIHLINKTKNIGEICIIWSAGKAGFNVAKREADKELCNFKIILNLAKSIIEQTSATVFFHLISSAGGLFEGNRFIDQHLKPHPLRDYGRLKLHQEKELNLLGKGIIKYIYRPTSVYGYAGANCRMGLIPTLIINAIRHKVSLVYGDLSTLRDYVLADDIGHFIESKLFLKHDNPLAKSFLLGSAKPSSILEIKHIVEQIVGRKLYLQLSPRDQLSNALDISINATALPSDWRVSGLDDGIRMIKEKIVSYN